MTAVVAGASAVSSTVNGVNRLRRSGLADHTAVMVETFVSLLIAAGPAGPAVRPKWRVGKLSKPLGGRGREKEKPPPPLPPPPPSPAPPAPRSPPPPTPPNATASPT